MSLMQSRTGLHQFWESSGKVPKLIFNTKMSNQVPDPARSDRALRNVNLLYLDIAAVITERNFLASRNRYVFTGTNCTVSRSSGTWRMWPMIKGGTIPQWNQSHTHQANANHSSIQMLVPKVVKCC